MTKGAYNAGTAGRFMGLILEPFLERLARHGVAGPNVTHRTLCVAGGGHNSFLAPAAVKLRRAFDTGFSERSTIRR